MKKLIQARTDTPTLHANKNQIAQIVKDKEKKKRFGIVYNKQNFCARWNEKKKNKKILKLFKYPMEK